MSDVISWVCRVRGQLHCNVNNSRTGGGAIAVHRSGVLEVLGALHAARKVGATKPQQQRNVSEVHEQHEKRQCKPRAREHVGEDHGAYGSTRSSELPEHAEHFAASTRAFVLAIIFTTRQASSVRQAAPCAAGAQERRHHENGPRERRGLARAGGARAEAATLARGARPTLSSAAHHAGGRPQLLLFAVSSASGRGQVQGR